MELVPGVLEVGNAHLDPKRARAAAGRIDAALGRTLPVLEEIAT